MGAEDLSPEVLLAALLAGLDSAGIGCCVIVEEAGALRRAYSNAPIAKMFGLTLDEMRTSAPLSALTSEERQRLTDMHRRGDRPPGLETKIARPDGSTLPVEVSMGAVALGPDGGWATVAFLRDISPGVEAAAALRESEERFRTIAESCPDWITMAVGERYVYANPVAMRILGVTRQEELAEVDPMAGIPESRREAIAERVARLKAGEVVPLLELRRKSAAGTDVFLEASTRSTTFSGRPADITYARDITERKELQARLMQHDRLAAVGTLAAGLAHELSNPLTYMGFHLKSLRNQLEAAAPGAATEILTEIEEGMGRMQGVIADLLFLTKDSEAPQAHVDVRKILESTLSLIRAGAGAGARITSDLALTSSLLGHPSRLGQVFLNVIVNALEAIASREDGHVRVALRESGSWLEVSVTDDGAGITEDSRSRVFDAFFTTKPEGTGLGLFISHTIVTAHGGQIAIDCPPAGGSVVTIRLPTTGARSG